MPLDTKPVRAASPLWIIALFIALSEAMASGAAVATSGFVRTLFALFATAFPVGVFSFFAVMLWKRPVNLYPPSEYTSPTSVEQFVGAIEGARNRGIVFAQAVAEAVVEGTRAESSEAPDAIRARMAETVERVIDSASVTVERHLILPEAEPVQLSVTPETAIDTFLDSIYFLLAPAVKPFTYTKSWILMNENQELLGEMGTAWAKEHGIERDTRPLCDVGIMPGMRLSVLSLGESRRRP